MLHERAARLAVALLPDLVVDPVALGQPAHDVARQPARAVHPDRPLDRHPAHQARVREVLLAAARLPDALVDLVPVLAQPVDDPPHVRPGLVEDRPAVLVEQVDRVDQLAVDVELALVGRAVADPHRRRVAIARQVRELLLGQLRAPVDPVHDLQRAARPVAPLAHAVVEPGHERRGLLGEAEPQQAVERERGVADPRVAVVPVALAAELLGQRAGRRGDDRAGRGERQQLERQRRAVDHLAPAAAIARVREPVAPVADGGLERSERLALGERPADVVGGHAFEHERLRRPRVELEASPARRPRRARAAAPSPSRARSRPRAPASGPVSGTAPRAGASRPRARRARSRSGAAPRSRSACGRAP